jgi:hypothetical protein
MSPKTRRTTVADKDQGPAAPDSHQPEGPPPMPGWVKGLIVAILLVAVLALVLALVFGVTHGPALHGSLGAYGGAGPVSSAGR